MFKKKQSLSERFSSVDGTSGEKGNTQSNRDLIARLRGRTEKWSSANNLHSDLLEKKTEDSKCIHVYAGSGKGKLNVTLKVNPGNKNGIPDNTLPTHCEDENVCEKSLGKEVSSLDSEKELEKKHYNIVPKLSVLEREYCDVAPQATYESHKIRRNNSSYWHGQKHSFPKRWYSQCGSEGKEWSRSQHNGHTYKAERRQIEIQNSSRYQEETEDLKFQSKKSTSIHNKMSEKGTAGIQKTGFHLPYCGFVESDVFQDEMDDLYQNDNHCYKRAFNTREEGQKTCPGILQPNKSLKMAPYVKQSPFNASLGSEAQSVAKYSKSPVNSKHHEMHQNFQKDNRGRQIGSPRTFQYKGFYSDVHDNDRCSTGADSCDTKSYVQGSVEKSEKDILVDSLFKHCQALVTNEQDKQALNQVRQILEMETGHEVSTTETDTSCKGSVINGENKEKRNFKKSREIPARFSPSISSTSSPDNNKATLLKFEGRTLLKGGVKPRHIPKSMIEKPGLDPPSDPRLKEKYGKTSCYLALPKWHKDFVLEQKDKMLKCINRSISGEIMNNNNCEESDRNKDGHSGDNTSVVDMELDEEPEETKTDLNEEYNPDLFEPTPSSTLSNEKRSDNDHNMMRSCSTAAEMEQSIMHFLKNVQSNDKGKVHSKEREVDNCEYEKVDNKLMKLLKDTRTEIEASLNFSDGESEKSALFSKTSDLEISEENNHRIHPSERTEMNGQLLNHKSFSSVQTEKETDKSIDFYSRYQSRNPNEHVSSSTNRVDRYRRRSRSRSGSSSRSGAERHGRSLLDKREMKEGSSHPCRYRSRSRSRSSSSSQILHNNHSDIEEKSICKQVKTDTFMPTSYRREDAYKRDLSPLYYNRNRNRESGTKQN